MTGPSPPIRGLDAATGAFVLVLRLVNSSLLLWLSGSATKHTKNHSTPPRVVVIGVCLPINGLAVPGAVPATGHYDGDLVR